MSNILIYSANPIGKKMAGPAIRCWELAKALSATFPVTLLCPNEFEGSQENFQICHHSRLRKLLPSSRAIITQNLTLSMACHTKKQGIKVIIDAYDPLPLEILELFKNHLDRHKYFNSSINQLIFNYEMADGIVCASEKQRDLWIGFLLSKNIINFKKYDIDVSLRKFIDVVPFGLSKIPPQKTGPGLREKFNFSENDKLILWGGGIWNWFDPLTLILAMGQVAKQRSDVKLVFLGIKCPDPSVPEMAMCARAIELAKELGLYHTTVFFNEGWIPYEDRQNYLLEGFLGVSTHFDHLETRYSFRTRMLDYIWAGLPILATEGDSFAELVEQQQVGIVVPYKNDQKMAEAILSLMDHPETLERMRKNLQKIAQQFHWEKVVEPIQNMVNGEETAEKNWKSIAVFLFKQVKEKGIGRSIKIALKKFC